MIDDESVDIDALQATNIDSHYVATFRRNSTSKSFDSASGTEKVVDVFLVELVVRQ